MSNEDNKNEGAKEVKEVPRLVDQMIRIQQLLIEGIEFFHENLSKKGDLVFEDFRDTPLYQIAPYFTAVKILFLSGQDITKSGIERLLNNADIEINKQTLNTLGVMHENNGMPYLYSIVILVSAKVEVTLQNIITVAISFDQSLNPDLETAKKAVEVYNNLAIKYGLDQISSLE